VVVYLLFSRYIHVSCSNFWHVSSIHVLAIDFRRGRAHSTVQSTALHTVCGVSIECLEWGSCYKMSFTTTLVSTSTNVLLILQRGNCYKDCWLEWM